MFLDQSQVQRFHTDGFIIVPDVFTGPEVGDRLPSFELPASIGRRVDLHADRGDSRAAVVFIRSAVW